MTACQLKASIQLLHAASRAGTPFKVALGLTNVCRLLRPKRYAALLQSDGEFTCHRSCHKGHNTDSQQAGQRP